KFLDLEAAVDEEEEEEEEGEEGEEDDFIDNTNPESQVLRWKVYEASVKDNEQTAAMLAELANPYRREVWCGSEHGWIYVEATMNPKLLGLLTLTPCIVFHRPGSPIKYAINIEERVATLKLPNLDADNLKVGDWARIVTGRYKDDLGIVVEVGESFKLLVIPRVQPEFVTRDLSHKRKHSAPSPRPSPALFDPIQFVHSWGKNLIQRGHLYTYRSYHFEHDLLLKKFGHRQVSSTSIFMPLSLSSLFCSSQHPTIQEIIKSGSRLPPPREWEFYEDEKVTITTGTHQGQEGVVQTVEADYILVDLSNGGGLFNFGWNNVQKCFKVKDFVQIINGPNQGHSGWVTEVLNGQMTCTELLERQPGREQSDFPELACARMAEVPYLWTSSTSATVTDNSGPDPSQPKESTRDQDPKHQPDGWLRPMRVPWKGTPVLVVGNGQHKGNTGR
ncbi:hypothetical protein H0H81_005371, partial [Sphagnurus paluster]